MLHNSYKGALIAKDLDQKIHLIEIITYFVILFTCDHF